MSAPAMAFANAVINARGGGEMFGMLLEQFPEIRREEVFLGVAIACLDRDATLMAADLEVRQLQRALERREAA
ncbi:MAG: hypothetical protein WAP03_13600 [Methylorubrum rhodinum]|uniref:hypothetical protein n=1 Tax=Methylorubrum rhodinum TaxID=29428 RepID=UPI003BB0C512